MQDLPDEALVQRVLSSPSAPNEAFDVLYGRHSEAVLMFLYGLHRHDTHAARDALQETFFRFFNALPTFKADRALRPWLLRIARNVSLDQFKRAGAKAERGIDPERLGELPGSEQGPAERAVRQEAVGILRRLILDLPGEQRAVFLLKHDQGMTYSEVAAALGCSLRTAKYRMQAALEEISREAERLGVEA